MATSHISYQLIDQILNMQVIIRTSSASHEADIRTMDSTLCEMSHCTHGCTVENGVAVCFSPKSTFYQQETTYRK